MRIQVLFMAIAPLGFLLMMLLHMAVVGGLRCHDFPTAFDGALQFVLDTLLPAGRARLLGRIARGVRLGPDGSDFVIEAIPLLFGHDYFFFEIFEYGEFALALLEDQL